MKKKCRICGTEFDAANPRYCLCSDACRKIAYKESNKKNALRYYHQDVVRDRRKIYYREHYKPVGKKCGMCGDVLPDGRATYCLTCLLKDHAKNPSIVTQKRLYNRGFDNLMIEEEIASMGLK